MTRLAKKLLSLVIVLSLVLAAPPQALADRCTHETAQWRVVENQADVAPDLALVSEYCDACGAVLDSRLVPLRKLLSSTLSIMQVFVGIQAGIATLNSLWDALVMGQE